MPDCKLTAYPEKSVIMVVNVEGTGGGTAFEVLAPSGKIYTLTNKHMCEHGNLLAVIGARKIPLRVIEESPGTDLCLLDPVMGIQGLGVASTPPKSGDKVDVYGYGALMPLTHTSGEWVGPVPEMMSLFFGIKESPEYTTAVILKGNSGSPVLNTKGEVLGVVFASSEMLNWRALIIGLKDLNHFLAPY